MRVTIIGKTASTISFNTLGIVLRGLTSAVHIDVKNDEQMREIITLKNAKLIDVEREDVVIPPFENKENKEKKVIKHTLAPISKEIKNETEETEETEEVEDGPSKTNQTSKNVEIKKHIGRPKGAKNKNQKIIKSTSQVLPSKSVIKPISRKSDNGDIINNTSTDVVVMTANGAVKTNTRNKMSGDIPDSDATKASIEALRILDEEERDQVNNISQIDESKLDPSERMGGKATIATGRNGTISVEMKNSLLPEADAIKNSVKFIDQDEEILKKNDKKSKEAFIDDGVDEEDNSFLEI